MLVVETFKARLQSQEQFQGICTLIPKLQTPASLEKDPDAGTDRGQEEKRETEEDQEAGHAVVHGIAKSWTRLSN